MAFLLRENKYTNKIVFGVPIFISISIFVSVVVISLVEFSLLSAKHKAQIDHVTSLHVESVVHDVEQVRAERYHALRRMADRVGFNPSIMETEWKHDAKGYLDYYREQYMVALLGPDKDAVWSVGDKEPHLLPFEQSGYGVPFDKSGEQAVQVAQPIERGGETVGFVVSQGLCGVMAWEIIQKYNDRGFGVCLTVSDIAIYCNKVAPEHFNEWGHTVNSISNGVELEVKIWPTMDYLEENRNPLVKSPLIFGPVIGAILAVSLYLILSAMRKNRALVVAHENLSTAHEQLRHLSTAVDQSNTALLVIDKEGDIEFVTDRFAKVFDKEPGCLIGLSVHDLKTDDKSLQSFLNCIINTASSGYPWVGEVRYTVDDEDVWEQASITPVYDVNGVVTHCLAMKYDITHRKELERRLNNIAYYDRLTGLYNRTYLEEQSGDILMRAARNEKMLAVLFMDLDHFKKINDSLGHEVGDQLLKEVSKRIHKVVRMDDYVIRLGGDEFLILLIDVASQDDVTAVARNIIGSIQTPIFLSDKNLYIGATIGVSMYPSDGEDIMSLMKHADTAMYYAKNKGRGNFHFFHSEMSEKAERNLELETKLRKALEFNEFALYYQPQIDFVSGEIVGVEALLRWNDPEKGIVSPAEFIPVLEDSGLIVDVGYWIICQVVGQVVEWHDMGYPNLLAAVNISGKQLQQEDFAQNVEVILRKCGFVKGVHNLELEVTESILMERKDEATQMLIMLNEKYGIQAAIDDFGTGYSSLSTLKSLPVDTLKIDRSFVKDVTHDSNDRAISEAVIALGKSLNLRIVSEGVETEEQRKFFKDRACDTYQGFLFSKPVPVEELTELLQSSAKKTAI